MGGRVPPRRERLLGFLDGLPLPSSSSNISYDTIVPFWTTGTQTCTSSVAYLNTACSPIVIVIQHVGYDHNLGKHLRKK